MQPFLVAWAALQRSGRSLHTQARHRLAADAGEGVISTAIAVLIMALIGAAMWAVFQTVFNDAGERIQDNVEQIQ
jgi:carbon starvation protein CstA